MAPFLDEPPVLVPKSLGLGVKRAKLRVERRGVSRPIVHGLDIAFHAAPIRNDGRGVTLMGHC